MIYLISEKEIKTALANQNLDANYLSQAIVTAQETVLEPLIGSYLYRTICNMVNNNTIKDEENSNYKLLLDKYINPFLIMQVISDIIIPISYKIGNVGIVQTTDTNLQVPGKSEIDYLVQYYADKAAVAGQRLTKYLHANHNIYKEFCKKEHCNDLLPESEAGYRINLNI